MKKMMMAGLALAIAYVAAGCCSMHKRCGTASCTTCGMVKPAGGQETMKPMAEINTSALKAMIDSGVKLTLVDARVGKYDDGRRIPNALNLGPDAKADEIQGMLAKDALIVSYCANLKCPASRQLAAKLMSMGYTRVLEYPEGIEGWVSEGNPTTQVVK